MVDCHTMQLARWLSSTPSSERRLGTRTPGEGIFFRATPQGQRWWTRRPVQNGWVVDMSPTGAGLRMRAIGDLRPGVVLTLEVGSLRGEAEIRHVSVLAQPGMMRVGIRFLHLDEELRRLVDGYVAGEIDDVGWMRALTARQP